MSFSSALFSTPRVRGVRRNFFLPLSLILCLGFAGLAPRAYATAAATTTTLAVTAGGSAATTVASGIVVTLTATVQSGVTAVTPGQVNFCDASATYCTDIHLLGTAQLTSAGTTVLKLKPGIGSHSYKAVFVGTSSYASSTSSASSLSVTGSYTTTTTIAQSGSSGNYTLTATVAGDVNTPSALAPTGTVSFLDTTNSNAVLGTASLGTGTLAQGFAAQVSYTTGSEPDSIAVGDFNGDGISDLAVANYGSSTVGIYLGNGDGTFQPQATYSTGSTSQPNFVAVGDFNGDGKLDLAVTSTTTNTVSIFLGNGDGTFPTSANDTYTTGSTPTSIAVGDFNGDGKLDLAVANYGSSTVSIFLGNGDGTFQTQVTYAAGYIYPRSVTAGDFNGDGKLDLAVVIQPAGVVSIFLGNGDGTFPTSANYTYTTGSQPISVAVGDFNGDGKPDLAIANLGDSTVSVLLGNGDGSFNTQVTYTTGSGPVSVAVGDFNGDGKPDLAVASQSSNTVSVLLGNGDGTFQSKAPYATGSTPNSVAVADINGDGIPDFAVANNGSSTAGVLLGQWTETSTASASGISPVGPSGSHAVEASYPGDSSFVASSSSTTSLTAKPAATTLTLSANPTSSTYSQQVVLTATLSPYTAQGYGTNGDTVTFSNNGTSLGTGTLSAGVAIFNVTSLPVGTNSLTAAYAGDSNFGSSSTATPLSFSVSKATPTISISNLPASGTYGGSFTPSFSYTGDGTTSVSSNSTSTCTVTSGVVHYVGVGTCSLTASATAGTNYSAVTGTAQTFSVGQATATVTLGSLSQTYTGSALAATATTNPSGLTVDFTYNGSSTAPTMAGSYAVVGTISDPNYQGSATGTLVLGKATATVSAWPTASGITYGQTLANSTLSGGTASVAGSFAWTTSTTSPGAGTQSESVTFTPTDTTDYNSVTGNVFVTVSKAFPTVSAWPTASGITYGQTLANSTLSGGTASVAGSFAWTTSSTSPGAGTQSESVTFTPTDTTVYATVTGSVMLTVNKATPAINWSAPAAIAYGTALSAAQLDATASYNGAAVPGVFTYNPTSGTVLSRGTQTLSVTFTPTDTTDYNSASASVAVSVGSAVLTVSANDATKIYGTANPAFTGSISGTLNGDIFTESFATAATTSSNVGTYAIVPSAAGTDLEDYQETIRNGTLTVTKAGSTVALASSTINANLNANVTFTATATSVTTGTPTGAVEFLDGSTVLGTAPLNSTGVATYSTTKLTAGTHSITAVYAGDTNFNESTSAQYAQTVTAPDYSLTANPASLTLKAGQTGEVTFTFAPVGGYTGTVNFACTGLPANVSCSFAPPSLTADGSNKQQTSLLTITTEGPNTGTVAINNGEGSGNMVAASIFWLPGLLFGCFLLWERKKLSVRTRQLLGMLLLVAAVSGLVGCAFGNPQAPSGAHTVTVTASAAATASGSGTGSSSGSGASHTATFTLTITQ